jgi:GNAT superfamily N-acetyltransferase
MVYAIVRAPDAAAAVPAALGRSDLIFGRAVLRWSTRPPDLPEFGEWVRAGDPRLPAWLRLFDGGALVAWDEIGRYAAGVGVKRHNAFGHELAVGTDPAHRGRGLARLLVAQAARRVLEHGALPLYLHETGNVASAHVGDAAGFPDRGWRLIGIYPAPIQDDES